MNYFEHLKANWTVAIKALILFLFHFIHGIVPCKLTDHNYWSLKL